MNTQPSAGGHAPPALIQGGYILVARQIVDSEIWQKPPLYLKVWIYLLTRAQHSSYKGLGAGQLMTSTAEIQKACAHKSGFRTETPTKDQIFQILKWLRTVSGSNDGAAAGAVMATTTRATRGILVDVRNYRIYQDQKSYGGNYGSSHGAVTGAFPDPATINKPGKPDKNVKHNILSTRADFSEEAKALAEYLRDRILGWKPNALLPVDLAEWAGVFHRMMSQEKRLENPISLVIEFATQDPFWQSNILSAAKLREKYDQLEAKMHAALSGNTRPHERPRGLVKTGGYDQA